MKKPTAPLKLPIAEPLLEALFLSGNRNAPLMINRMLTVFHQRSIFVIFGFRFADTDVSQRIRRGFCLTTIRSVTIVCKNF